MFASILRSLGLIRSPEPSRIDPSVDASNGIATITVRLPADRARPGTLEAFDAAGQLISGPWAAVGQADPAQAAAHGNLSRGRMRPWGDTPEGVFAIVGRRDANPVFGPNQVLALQPQSGAAAMADANGRGTLLLHGGVPFLAPTDGSLRAPDDAMAEMLDLLPAVSEQRAHVTLTVRDDPGFNDWLDALPEFGSPARRAWFRAQGYAAGDQVGVDDGWDGGSDWPGVYETYYAEPGSWDLGPVDGWQADQAAAAGLEAAGLDSTPPAAAPVDVSPFDGPGVSFPTGGAYDR